MFPTNTSREHAVQQFATGILQRVADAWVPTAVYATPCPQLRFEFEEALQNAISGVLAGLDDDKQADLYARIVSGLEQGVGTLGALIVYEVRATQLWSAL